MVSADSPKPKRKTATPPTGSKNSLESIFHDYLSSVQKTFADSQAKSSDIYEDYLRQVGDSYAELQKQVANIQRDYETANQKALSKADEASERTAKIYSETVRVYEQLLEDTQRKAEQINNKLVSLLAKQGKFLQKQSTQALTTYMRELQKLIQSLDCASVPLSDLQYLGVSVGTVALYANAIEAMSKSGSVSTGA